MKSPGKHGKHGKPQEAYDKPVEEDLKRREVPEEDL